MRIAYLLSLYVTRSQFFCAGHLVEIAYWYELLCHIIPTLPNEQASILTVISVGINFHKPLPCDLSRQAKSQASLTFHNDYKTDKPYKSTLLRGISSSVPLLQSLRGVFLLPFLYFLFFFPPPPNLLFSSALVTSVLHFHFLQRRTLY